MDPAVPGTSGQDNFHTNNEQNYDSDGSVDFIHRVVDDSSSDNSSACSESDDEATVIEVLTWEYYNNRYEAEIWAELVTSIVKEKQTEISLEQSSWTFNETIRDQHNMRPAPVGDKNCDVTTFNPAFPPYKVSFFYIQIFQHLGSGRLTGREKQMGQITNSRYWSGVGMDQQAACRRKQETMLLMRSNGQSLRCDIDVSSTLS
ncbi:hypothetical protein J6590_060730 [Homalodisca vitripennis]|nr:hypothetical protein J6590_060730 [Homalodisca vitripennis]